MTRMKTTGLLAGIGIAAAALFAGPATADVKEYDPRATYESVGEDRAAQVVRRTCQACHGAGQGFMGAPRVGRNQDWEWRLDARGFDLLVHNTIRGIGSMPPRGGNSNLTDEEVAAAVYKMMKDSDVAMD